MSVLIAHSITAYIKACIISPVTPAYTAAPPLPLKHSMIVLPQAFPIFYQGFSLPHDKICIKDDIWCDAQMHNVSIVKS